ncbi:multifunctional CCA tRNA nucleotidyl transferase/2'3'-cyclic phosphodiesterase/2'nucleotidase/phosphatase [bacterium]|nr:multifunctional CCA tRNA nucleotidyl transferase/2'3'-cyclic phosphodiesterase/2'nucleotidase/phosphatase [bacterium]
MNTFLVGGACRDILLGLEPKDKDFVVVGSTPEVMLSLGFKQVGADFPVFLSPEGEEFALARTERSTGEGHTDFECVFSPDVTLEEDLKRRDLTINSMAMDEEGNITDPFGGRKDLDNKILRATSEAFSEDPLRVLRVARFWARLGDEWTIEEGTVDTMQRLMQSGAVKAISGERLWKETERAMTEPAPWVFFSILLTALDIKSQSVDWAELKKMIKVAQESLCSTEEIFTLCLGEIPSEESDKLIEILKVPNSFEDTHRRSVGVMGFACVRSLNNERIQQILEHFDFFRNEEHLLKNIRIEKCIFSDDDDFSELWLAFAAAAKSVKAKPFVDQGLQGKEIGDMMRLERLERIQEVLDENQNHQRGKNS